jgi:STE24 endopeptidase
VSPRAWAAIALAVLLVALAAAITILTPWHRAPAPRADQLAALASLPPDRVATAKDLHRELRFSSYPSMLIGLVVALIIGLTPLGAKIVNAVPGPWPVKAVLGGLLVVLIGEAISLPFAAWQHTVRARYGLDVRTWGGWTVDQLKGLAVGAVLGGIVLLLFFAGVRWSPRWWWTYGAVGAAGLVVLLTFVFPVLIEPVFNKFTPMSEGPLRTSLLSLAERDGVPVKDVLVADASRRTTALNAYVSGLGPTRRIVVYDTLLKEATPAEIESVVAHELGHAKAGDVVTGTLIGALGTAALVVAIFLLGGWTGLLRRAGVDSITDPRAIGLLLAIATIVGLIAGPGQAFVSRQIEARADQHALELTGDAADFESMEAKLALVNLGDPDPPKLEQWLFGSHPTAVERMAAARAFARR